MATRMMLSKRQRNLVLSLMWELGGPGGARVINWAEILSLTAAPKIGKEPSEIIQFIIPIHNITPNYNIIPIYNPSYVGDFCARSPLVFDFSIENKLPLC